MYLAVLGLHCCVRTLPSHGERGLLSSCGVWVSPAAGSSCCREWAPGHSGFSSCGPRALEHWLSSCARLSCSMACGLFLDQGSNQCPPHWLTRFLTPRPPGKSTRCDVWSHILPLHFLLYVDLQKHCKDSTEFHLSFPELLLMISSYIIVMHLSKLKGEQWHDINATYKTAWCYLNTSDFSTNAISLSQDPIRNHVVLDLVSSVSSSVWDCYGLFLISPDVDPFEDCWLDFSSSSSSCICLIFLMINLLLQI